jgi:hypothetical protein
MSRKIIRLRDGKEYESLSLAADENQCDISDLSRAARFGKIYCNSMWKFDNDDIPGEEWKPHPLIPHLKVSNIGRLEFKKGRRSFGTFRTKGVHKLSSGIRRNGRHRTVYHHEAVALAWLNLERPIYHIDGDVENNFAYNLRN